MLTSLILWARANSDIAIYKIKLDELLNNYNLPFDALSCHDHCYQEHNINLQMFHDVVVGACLTASKCILSSKHRKSPLPGWSEFVKPWYRDKAILCHNSFDVPSVFKSPVFYY